MSLPAAASIGFPLRGMYVFWLVYTAAKDRSSEAVACAIYTYLNLILCRHFALSEIGWSSRAHHEQPR
jgi:hypothetical protein